MGLWRKSYAKAVREVMVREFVSLREPTIRVDICRLEIMCLLLFVVYQL
jgi:hypothetical protein